MDKKKLIEKFVSELKKGRKIIDNENEPWQVDEKNLMNLLELNLMN